MEPEGSLPHSQVPATCPNLSRQSRFEALSVNISLQCMFLRWGAVSTSPKPQAGGPTLVGCPRLLIQYIRSYPPYWRPFLHPQPEDAPCRCDRDPSITALPRISDPTSLLVGRVAQLVYRLVTGWTVRRSNPGGVEIFRTCPNLPWGPSSILYNGYRVFPGGKERLGRDADPSPPSSATVMKG